MMYYKPTLFRADVREIAHGLIICTIRYTRAPVLFTEWVLLPSDRIFTLSYLLVIIISIFFLYTARPRALSDAVHGACYHHEGESHSTTAAIRRSGVTRLTAVSNIHTEKQHVSNSQTACTRTVVQQQS